MAEILNTFESTLTKHITNRCSPIVSLVVYLEGPDLVTIFCCIHTSFEGSWFMSGTIFSVCDSVGLADLKVP